MPSQEPSIPPTCVSIAGGKVPAEPVNDGRDLSPLLFDKTTESQREAHCYFAGYNLQAVRQVPWKVRRPAGEVANPQTLYPTSEAPRGKKKDAPIKTKK